MAALQFAVLAPTELQEKLSETAKKPIDGEIPKVKFSPAGTSGAESLQFDLGPAMKEVVEATWMTVQFLQTHSPEIVVGLISSAIYDVVKNWFGARGGS